MSEKKEVKEVKVKKNFEGTTKITIGKKEYDIVKKGFEQARQIPRLLKWLTKYVIPAMDNLDGLEISESISTRDIFRLIGVLGDTLDDNALADLYILVIGCSQDEMAEYFDLNVLIDAVVCLWSSESVYREVISRFFSTTPSE